GPAMGHNRGSFLRAPASASPISGVAAHRDMNAHTTVSSHSLVIRSNRLVKEVVVMLTLYFAPGACSMAAPIVLEESGEKYEPKKVDLAGGEQRTEAYLKINPQGRVPALRLDNGENLAENTAILPYLGKRFGLWPADPLAEAKALSLIGFFAAVGDPPLPQLRRHPPYASSRAPQPDNKVHGRT